MRVLVAGGRLQGVEAAYLAREAGWEICLVDRDPMPPAINLCDVFHHMDILEDEQDLRGVIRGRDLVIPALEDLEVLDCLERATQEEGVPFAYHSHSYWVSCSKIRSDRLFEGLGIPRPMEGTGRFPLICKPSGSSGSDGVRKVLSEGEYEAFVDEVGRLDDWVIQEYLEGPSYSLEVVGTGEDFRVLQVTNLEMDSVYDCKRVTAPSDLSPLLREELEAITIRIARALGLRGVMDIEVILHKGLLKVLEIDARLPSQTPTAVYKSTGQNILEWLKGVFLEGRLPSVEVKAHRAVIYEHVRPSGDSLEVVGEHVMAVAGPLTYQRGFFGADEALTNFKTPGLPWAATLIHTGSSLEEVWEKRERVIRDMVRHCGLSGLRDGDAS